MLHFTLHPKLLDSKGPRVPHGAIPLREGEPTAEQPSWGYVVSTEITPGFSPRQPQREDCIQCQLAPFSMPCGERHVENLTVVPLPSFPQGNHRLALRAPATVGSCL